MIASQLIANTGIFQDKWSKKCGCYIRRPLDIGIKYQAALVPLRHIDYHLQIVNSLLNITLKQKYFNPTDKFLEVDYSLPISPESSIYKFEAEFGDVKIEGIVKEKQEAKREFEKAKSEGKQAVIGTIDPDSKDILNMEIGNIPPNTQFTVTISLLQEMKVSQNTFYRLQIPSTISPRYMNQVEGIAKKPEHMQHEGKSSSGKPDFDWTFKVDLHTTHKVIFFDSPSHDIKMLSQNEKGTETLLVMEKSQTPNKDFTFVYTTQNFHLPSSVVGNTDISSTVMMSFIPKFCTLEVTDAYKASVENKSYQTDMETAKGDYIFFLDRSGSMGGTRINKAKQALVLFLKSLPADSYFNVISFGYGSQRIYAKSQKNTSKKIQETVKKVKSMSADMGGTQIYNPLHNLLNQKVVDGYPRHIFLLTDGGVSNTQGVLQMVKKNTKYSRVHSIGIGNGASFDLIQGCANNGKGKYVMIADDENPSQKIIQLLQTTLTPLISKVDLKYDHQNEIESIVPNPKSIPYILKDETANFYITFKGPLTQKRSFTFEYEDSVSKLPYKAVLEVEPTTTYSQSCVDKMAHLKVLRALENSAKDGVEIEQQIHYVKVKDYKQEAIKYSVKHQVLSEYTAFLCIGKQLVDGKYQQFKNTGVQKIHVEQPKPEQYQFEQRQMCKALTKSSLGSANVRSRQAVPLAKAMKKQSAGLGIMNAIGSIASSLFSGPAKSSKPAQLPKAESSTKNMKTVRDQMQHFKKSAQRMQMNMKMAMEDEDQQCEIQIQKQKKQVQTKKSKKKISEVQNRRSSKVEYDSKPDSSSSFSSNNVSGLIEQQTAQGSWSNTKIIDTLALNPQQVHQLCKNIQAQIVVTKLVIIWLQKHHPEKQYALIIKKAIAWLKKAQSQHKIQDQVLCSISCT